MKVVTYEEALIDLLVRIARDPKVPARDRLTALGWLAERYYAAGYLGGVKK